MGEKQKAIFHTRAAEKLAGQNQNQALQNKAFTKLNVLNEKYTAKK